LCVAVSWCIHVYIGAKSLLHIYILTMTTRPSRSSKSLHGHSSWKIHRLGWSFVVLYIVSSNSNNNESSSRFLPGVSGSAVRCTTDDECQALIPDYFSGGEDGEPRVLLSEGSVCNVETGLCTNPFERGCLYNRLPGWTKKRVCNSEDPPLAAEMGLCDEPVFDEYMEVRIASGNWESIFFNAWLVQILLSEVLGVPTTLEPGSPNVRIAFYESTGAVEYGILQHEKAFDNADRFTDCSVLLEQNREVMLLEDKAAADKLYQPCAHVVPEFWDSEGEWALTSVNNGTMEPTDELGVLARENL
jgi:hypothetical protein